MSNLREQLLGLDKGQQQKEEQNNDQDPPIQKPAPRSKEDNLAALRRAKEEQDELLKSLQGENEELKSKSQKLEDAKFKALFEKIASEYEDDAEKFLGEFDSLKSTSSEWEVKLREKEELLERTAFEKSEAFQKNVAQPVKAAEELLKGVIKKDEGLYRKLIKDFVYDKDGKVATGSFNADDIIALDEALEEFDSLKPDRVKTAIENLRETFHKANEFNSNFKQRLSETEAQRQAALAEKNAQEAGVAKLARAQAVKSGAARLLADEGLKSVLGEEFASSIPKLVLQSVESSIASRSLPSLEDMAQNQMKALMFDHIVSNGGIDLLKQAIASLGDHSTSSLGTKGTTKPPEKKATGSVIDMIAKSAGVDRRMQLR